MRTLLFVLAFVAAQAAWAETVDINSADADTLDKTMAGIGKQKAAAIVEYRTQHGPFKSIEELDKVPGIGSETIKKNKDKITVTPTPVHTTDAPK